MQLWQASILGASFVAVLAITLHARWLVVQHSSVAKYRQKSVQAVEHLIRPNCCVKQHTASSNHSH